VSTLTLIQCGPLLKIPGYAPVYARITILIVVDISLVAHILVTCIVCWSWRTLGATRGHVVGTFLEKVLLLAQLLVPSTCCMKFNWFKFVRHEAGPK